MTNSTYKPAEEKEQLDIKALAGYITAYLIFLSSARLVNNNKALDLPILNYISFSNLVLYILDVTYSLNKLIIAALLLVLFRGIIYRLIRKCSKTLKVVLMITGGIVTIVVWSVLYCKYFSGEYLLQNQVICIQYLLFIGVLIPSLILLHLMIITPFNKNVLVTLMLFVFTWCYIKSVSKFELGNQKRRALNNQAKIVFKDSLVYKEVNLNAANFLVTNTQEFVFTYDTLRKQYTAYPMAEVFSITDGDSLKNKRTKTP
jgi:hypothetical protein